MNTCDLLHAIDIDVYVVLGQSYVRQWLRRLSSTLILVIMVTIMQIRLVLRNPLLLSLSLVVLAFLGLLLWPLVRQWTTHITTRHWTNRGSRYFIRVF